MAHPDDPRPTHRSRDQRHRTGGAIHFPVIDPDGITRYIVSKRASGQGVQVLTDEDGNQWRRGQRQGHVEPFSAE